MACHRMTFHWLYVLLSVWKTFFLISRVAEPAVCKSIRFGRRDVSEVVAGLFTGFECRAMFVSSFCRTFNPKNEKRSHNYKNQ